MDDLTERFGSVSLSSPSKIKWEASLKKKLFLNDDRNGVRYCKMYKRDAKQDPYVAAYPSNDKPMVIEKRQKDEKNDYKKAESLIRKILTRIAKTLRMDSASGLYDYSESDFRTCFFAVALSSKDLFDEYGFYYDEDDRSVLVTEEPLAGSTSMKYGYLKDTLEKCRYHSKNALKSREGLKFKPDHVFLDFSIKLRKWKKCSFFLQRDEKDNAFSLKHDGYVLSDRCFVFDFELKYQNMKYTIVTKLPSTEASDFLKYFEYASDDNNASVVNYKDRFENIKTKASSMKPLREMFDDRDDFFRRFHETRNEFEKSRYESERLMAAWRRHIKKNEVTLYDDIVDDADAHNAFSFLMHLRFKPYGEYDFKNHLMVFYSEAVNGRTTDSKTKGGLAHYRLYREREFDAFLKFKNALNLFKTDDIYQHPSIYGVYDEGSKDAQRIMDVSSVKNISIVSVVVLGVVDVIFYDIVK